MAKESGRQKEIVGRVMHEFKHGELESAGRTVRTPPPALAIGLRAAGASNQKSAGQNRRSRAKTEAKERKGETAQQRKEGRGKASASKTRTSSRKPSSPRASRGEPTRAQLYAEAQRRGLSGVSRLSKADLEQALRQH